MRMEEEESCVRDPLRERFLDEDPKKILLSEKNLCAITSPFNPSVEYTIGPWAEFAILPIFTPLETPGFNDKSG